MTAIRPGPVKTRLGSDRGREREAAGVVESDAKVAGSAVAPETAAASVVEQELRVTTSASSPGHSHTIWH